MTIEEIEARWKAATPGPWRWDVDRGSLWPTDWCVSDQDTPSDDDARAFASAPTDIAYLLDRVRKLERAHAWFVENTNTNDSRRVVDHCQYCGRCDWARFPHDCEWVKARDLTL